jgi:integrase
MEKASDEFIKYFNKFANRIKTQGDEIKHWYKEIDFNDIVRKIEINLEIQYKKLESGTESKLDIKRFLYYAIALLQVTNGLRSTEAIKGLQIFLKEKEKVISITAGKSKLERWAIIPPILFEYYNELKKYSEILKGIRKQSYYNFIKNNLGINPHSLRYAFINHMISKGIAPEKLVVYMGYSSFKHMINYYRIASVKDEIIREIKNALYGYY